MTCLCDGSSFIPLELYFLTIAFPHPRIADAITGRVLRTRITKFLPKVNTLHHLFSFRIVKFPYNCIRKQEYYKFVRAVLSKAFYLPPPPTPPAPATVMKKVAMPAGLIVLICFYFVLLLLLLLFCLLLSCFVRILSSVYCWLRRGLCLQNLRRLICDRICWALVESCLLSW